MLRLQFVVPQSPANAQMEHWPVSEAKALEQHHMIVTNRKSPHALSTSTMPMFSAMFMRSPQHVRMTITSLFQSFRKMSLPGQEPEEIHGRCFVSLHKLSGVPQGTLRRSSPATSIWSTLYVF